MEVRAARVISTGVHIKLVSSVLEIAGPVLNFFMALNSCLLRVTWIPVVCRGQHQGPCQVKPNIPVFLLLNTERGEREGKVSQGCLAPDKWGSVGV